MKILVVNNNMQVGGIQKSLVGFLGEISKKHTVSLVLFHPQGELLPDVAENVKIIKGNFFSQLMGMTRADAASKGKLCSFIRAVCVAITRISGAGLAYRILASFHKPKEKYDVAISFMQNSSDKIFYGGCNEFVLNSVKADKKIAFIHCDFKNYPGNTPYNRRLYKKFDAVACVSDSVKNLFVSQCPECMDKSFTVYNMHDFESIDNQASDTDIKKEDVPFIFTSARLSEEKGILRMLPIFDRIKKKGGNFKWYIAGYGPLHDKAVQCVSELSLDDDVVFLGMVKNPYPYFKCADMVLVPSYNEAAPMVYTEANIFGTPVFTTNITSSYEMLSPEDNWIVDNTDEAIEHTLSDLLLNPENIYKKTPSIEKSNTKAINQFENLIR